MNRYWFRRKIIGFGATPTTWQGWAVVLVYVGLMIGLARYLNGRQSPSHLPVFLIVSVILTSVLVWIIWIKTEGGLRWTWGGGDRKR